MILGIGRLGQMRRMAAITAICAKHGFGNLFDRLFGRRSKSEPSPLSIPAPRRLRLALEELGPSFIKLGQLLSTRADILPQPYIEELKKLQDQVPPEPYDRIQDSLTRALGSNFEDKFKSFTREAEAAASVAQVHRAELPDGTKVAVKIIRPGIAKKIRADLKVMYSLARRIEKRFKLGRVVGAINLVSEFERTVFKELDMSIEAANIQKFDTHFKMVNEIQIPTVFWDYTSKSILVMEYMPGVKVDDVRAIRKMGVDPQGIAMIGLRSLSRQLFEFGYFHADPHPGNTIVMDDGRVALVDFGIMGYLDSELMHQVAKVILGYSEHNYDFVMEALEDAGLVDPEKIDLKRFRSDLKEISEPFYGRSLLNITVRDVYDEIISLVIKYQLELPRNLLLLLKTLIQTEALGKILGSGASILHVMRPYAKELIRRRYEPDRLFEDLGNTTIRAGEQLRSAPKLVSKFLNQLASGRHRAEIHLTGLRRLDHKFETGINRLTVGLVIAASLIAGSLVLNASQNIINIQLPFLGPDPISLTSLLGVIGYSIASVLGLWLIISIMRSGKM